MENELVLNVEQIVVKQGSVEFNQYDRIKKQAQQLANEIEKVEVNEENIKQSKKLLAAVNKRLKELEDRRIEIKKHMLEPYQEFEEQVKEIVTIVKHADTKVREQLKDLEEYERSVKKEMLEDLFEKRVKLYSFKNLFSFEDFYQPRHLNKTTSLKSIEDEMVVWLEKRETDLKVIESTPNAEKVLSAYVDRLDLAEAMNKVSADEQRRQQIEAAQVINKKQAPSKVYTIRLFNEKDLKLVEMFMKQENVEHEIVGQTS